jgi:hypothetical protein
VVTARGLCYFYGDLLTFVAWYDKIFYFFCRIVYVVLRYFFELIMPLWV